MVDGVNNAGANRSVNNADAVPAHRPDFRGMTVRQICIYGSKNENYGDAKAAAEHLGDLAREGDTDAKRALLAALRGAKSDPTNAFALAAKIKFDEISSNAQKQRTNMAPFHKVARPAETPQDRYNTLTRLLKFEFRGGTNTVREDTNLLTGKTKEGDENSLTIVQFYKNLEKKGVAHIAVAWFEELATCNLEPIERITLQTGLVKTLEQLQKSFIVKLEEIRSSGTSGPGQDLVGLSNASDYSSQDLKQLVKLRAQFKMQPLDQLYELRNVNLIPKRIELLKDLKQRFPEVRLKELNDAARRINNAQMGWLKDLNTLFSDASLEELSKAVRNLNDAEMGRLKKLKALYPKKLLEELSELADLLEAKKISMERFKKLHNLFPEEHPTTLFFAVRDLETDQKWIHFVELKAKYPKALAGALSEAVNKLVTEEDWKRFKKLENRHSKAPFRELVYATVFFKDEAGLERLKKLKELFPNAPLRSLRLADLYLNKEEPTGSKRMARTQVLHKLFKDATLGTLAYAASRLDDKGMERLEQLKTRFPKEPFNEFRRRLQI